MARGLSIGWRHRCRADGFCFRVAAFSLMHDCGHLNRYSAPSVWNSLGWFSLGVNFNAIPQLPPGQGELLSPQTQWKLGPSTDDLRRWWAVKLSEDDPFPARFYSIPHAPLMLFPGGFLLFGASKPRVALSVACFTSRPCHGGGGPFRAGKKKGGGGPPRGGIKFFFFPARKP